MRSTTKEVRNTHTPMIVNMNLLSCQQPVITKQIFGRLLATFLPLPVSSSPGPTLVGCERSLNLSRARLPGPLAAGFLLVPSPCSGTEAESVGTLGAFAKWSANYSFLSNWSLQQVFHDLLPGAPKVASGVVT